MSPRSWPTTCDNPGVTEYYGVRLRLAHLSIRFGRPPIAKAEGRESQAVPSSGKGVRENARMAGISPASVSRIKTSMNAEAAIT